MVCSKILRYENVELIFQIWGMHAPIEELYNYFNTLIHLTFRSMFGATLLKVACIRFSRLHV